MKNTTPQTTTKARLLGSSRIERLRMATARARSIERTQTIHAMRKGNRRLSQSILPMRKSSLFLRKNISKNVPHKREARRNIFEDLEENNLKSPIGHTAAPPPEPLQRRGLGRDTESTTQETVFKTVSGTPWTADLAKIQPPVLKFIEGLHITKFQVEYKRYLERIEHLEERYAVPGETRN